MGAWNEEPAFTPEIGVKALASTGYKSGDRFVVAFTPKMLTELAEKHGTMPFGQYACDIAIAETFKLGIWSAASFSDYFDCDCHIKRNKEDFRVSIWIGYPIGKLGHLGQFIFDTKRLLGYWFGY